VVAPAGTPREVLVRLNAAVAKAVAAPQPRGRFLELGVELTASASPEAFMEYIRAEFVKKADAVCKQRERRIRHDFLAYVSEHRKELEEPTEENFSDLADAILAPRIEQEIDEIRSLGAPKGDVQQVEAILVSLEKGIDEGDGKPRAMVEDTADLFAESGKLAGRYGLKLCTIR